jgi:hypothetical protein
VASSSNKPAITPFLVDPAWYEAYWYGAEVGNSALREEHYRRRDYAGPSRLRTLLWIKDRVRRCEQAYTRAMRRLIQPDVPRHTSRQ